MNRKKKDAGRKSSQQQRDGQPPQEPSGIKKVLRRLFNHRLDKPASTTQNEIWMTFERRK